MTDERIRKTEREIAENSGRIELLERLAVQYERTGNYRLAAKTAQTATKLGSTDPKTILLAHQTGCLVRKDPAAIHVYFNDTLLERIDLNTFLPGNSQLLDFATLAGAAYFLARTSDQGHHIIRTEINGDVRSHPFPPTNIAQTHDPSLSEHIALVSSFPAYQLIAFHEDQRIGVVCGPEPCAAEVCSTDGTPIPVPPPRLLARFPQFDIRIGFHRSASSIMYRAYAHSRLESTHNGFYQPLESFSTLHTENKTVFTPQLATGVPLHFEDASPEANLSQLILRGYADRRRRFRDIEQKFTERYGVRLPASSRLHSSRTFCADETDLASTWDKNLNRLLLETPLCAIEGLLLAYEQSRGAR